MAGEISETGADMVGLTGPAVKGHKFIGKIGDVSIWHKAETMRSAEEIAIGNALKSR